MPSATLLFTNSAGQLAANPAGFLHVTWGTGARTLAATKALFEQMLGQLQRHSWSRVLIDQTAMLPFDKAEQTWIAADWLPRAVREGGYRYGAVVVSPTVLVRLATAFITTYVQGLPLTYRSFDTEADARHWLVQQPG
jgi:hypothetical protein